VPVLTSRVRHLLAPAVAAGLLLAVASPALAAEPDTIINSGPENGAVVLPGPVQFSFSSDVGPVTFQCKVDTGAFATCTSPATYDLAPGGHTFTVRALDAFDTPDSSPASRIWTVRNVPCEQAGAAYAAAQSKYFVQQQKLVKAKKQLHRAHAHGTAAEFQHAKNKVRHIKAKIFKFKTQMDEAIALEAAVC
jgi:hypothetical protein